MIIEDLTSSQKKTIITAIALIIGSCIFGLLVYLPIRNYVAGLKIEVLSLEKQIQEIDAILGKTKSIEGAVKLITKRYGELNSKFHREEKESLDLLSRFAKRFNIVLVSIKAQGPAAYLDEENKRVAIEGRACQKVPVTLQMSCYYNDLVRYIQKLRSDFPAFVMVEKLKVNKDAVVKTRLNVVLGIDLYLL